MVRAIYSRTTLVKLTLIMDTQIVCTMQQTWFSIH